jgi:dynein heavy chain
VLKKDGSPYKVFTPYHREASKVESPVTLLPAPKLPTPLMIDPQRQANRWVRQTYKNDNLCVIKPNANDLLRALESAIRFGAPVLLEDVPETGLDAVLDPILLQQLSQGPGGQMCVQIGDANDVPWDPNFKLFCTTRLANPHFLPDMCI